MGWGVAPLLSLPMGQSPGRRGQVCSVLSQVQAVLSVTSEAIWRQQDGVLPCLLLQHSTTSSQASQCPCHVAEGNRASCCQDVYHGDSRGFVIVTLLGCWRPHSDGREL